VPGERPDVVQRDAVLHQPARSCVRMIRGGKRRILCLASSQSSRPHSPARYSSFSAGASFPHSRAASTAGYHTRSRKLPSSTGPAARCGEHERLARPVGHQRRHALQCARADRRYPVRLARLRILTQAVAGHHLCDREPRAQPVDTVAVQAGTTRAGRSTLHARKTGPRGEVVDPTWGDRPGRCGHYFGIMFRDLPEGDDVGISVLADLLGGKLVSYDRLTGWTEIADGDSELARLVQAQGGATLR
jgi:hypothetical protein